MTKEEFLLALSFPREWSELKLYPDELFKIQEAEFEPQHVNSAEHTRSGAFLWWLYQEPAAEVLEKLALAARAEPDYYLRKDIEHRIRVAKHFNNEIASLLDLSS